MKIIHIISISILIFLFISCDNGENKYFKIKKTDPMPLLKVDISEEYFNIYLNENNSLIQYPVDVSNLDENTKLLMIKELLNYNGNKEICSFPIMNYNNALSQIYTGDSKEYSIQLAALYLINQIFFDKPFNYSPLPLLINRNTGDEEAIGGEIIITAFKDYEKWFKTVNNIGIEKAKKEKIYPLNKSDVSWIFGIGN